MKGIREGTNGRDQSRSNLKGSEKEQMEGIKVGTNGRVQRRNKWTRSE
jgi:hypothetical protein